MSIAAPKVGDSLLARYELVRDLGRGNVGQVFQAVQQFTGRRVALKLVDPSTPLGRRPELNARLVREAKALASVRHPGVVEVLDGGFLHDGTPFIVMEMREGRTLEGLLTARGRLSVEDTVALALQLASSLDAAHAAGVVHRDLTPSNVLIVHDHARREAIKLIDFGLAQVHGDEGERLTGIGPLPGTPTYMPPEQFLGLDGDARVDIYALGVLMLECLTGRVPYPGTYQEVLLRVCSPDPAVTFDAASAGVPAPLVEIVRTAMAKDGGARFSSMKELRAALRALDPKARTHTELFGPPPVEDAPQPARADSRRKLVRASYVTPVRIMVGDLTVDGRTEDISTGGLLVVCHQVCPTEKATMKFALPTEGKVISVDVQVRWVKAARASDPEGPRALGVEFINPPPEMIRSIAHYVSFMTVPEPPPKES